MPRLIAAGANLALVHELPGELPLSIRREQRPFRALMEDHGVKVVVFDQFLDNLGANVDDWRAKEVRHAVAPLRRLVAELDVAPIASLHTNKGNGTFRQRVAGTQAFNSLSRSSLLLAAHLEDSDRRVLVRGKGNYVRTPASRNLRVV